MAKLKNRKSNQSSAAIEPSIAQQHQAMLDKVLTPPQQYNDVSGIRDTQDGPYWGAGLPAQPMSNSRLG